MTARTLIQHSLTALGLVAASSLIIAVFWLRLHSYQFLSVQSGSMVPTLRKGDLVLVSRVPVQDVQVGDIVTYINPANAQQTITHRVIAAPTADTGYRFVTKGDANPIADSSILPGAIIGVHQHHIPWLGYLADAIRHPIGLIALIYIPAIAIIYSEIRRLMRHYRAMQPYISPGLSPY